MFSMSTDDGQNWSWPIRINDDPGMNAYQWFGTMSVAPDGRIDVIWLDTRDNPGTVMSSLYYSYSLDGGFTWTPNERLTEEFNPHLGWPQQDKMGDYLDMFSDEAGAHLAWANTFNGEQDVYYALIVPDYVGVSDKDVNISNLRSKCSPNPFTDRTTIRYFLSDSEKVSLKIFTSSGRELTSLVNEVQVPGFHNVVFDATGLANGIYYYRLQTSDDSETGKLVIVD
jgi:hypothetical protein